MSALLAIDAILARLSGVRQSGDQWLARCPAHEDDTASLSVSVGREGRILFRCFAGCENDSIRRAMNLEWSQLLPPKQDGRKRIVSTYDYKGLDGLLKYQSVRYEPKGFSQRRPDGQGGWIANMTGVQRIPYRLSDLKGRGVVYIVEGEKDVDALWRSGVAATTNVGGAGKWRQSDSATLKQIGVQKCILIPDNDQPGRKHMEAVEHGLKQVGIAVVRVDLVELPNKGDVSDWLASGRTVQDLETLASRKPYVIPRNGSGEFNDGLPPDPYGAAQWKHTDLGIAESFVGRFGEKVRYNHKHKEWLIWNCHHWKLDHSEEIRRKANEHVRLWQSEALSIRDRDTKQQVERFTLGLETSSKLKTIVDISRALEPCADNGHNWDGNAFLLGCPNGVVDLQTGELRAGKPDDRITLQTAIAFNADAPSERWSAFIQEIFCDDADLIGFIQRAIGYSLTGDTREQCFFMCVGHGANGKSTFLSSLSAVWGDYAYTTDTNVFATNASSRDSTAFDLAELLNRRMVLMSETKANSRMNEQSIKNFTGGERINAQKKFGNPFEFEPVGKLWMGVNHQPKVMDDSHGFWRRVRLIPFTRTFSGSTDNRNLRRELALEGPGILAWAVRGCRDWIAQGLNPPMSVMKATDAYQDAEDPVLDYLAERTEPDSSAETPCNGTYLAYKDWAKDQGMTEKEMLSKNSFGRLMSRRYERRHTMMGWRYVGLRVKVRPKDLFHGVE